MKRIEENTNIYDHYTKIDIGTILATHEGPFIGQKSTKEINGDIYLERDSWGRLNRHSRSGYFFEERSIVEAAKEGGVIIGAHSIDYDIPVENYDYYYSMLEKLDKIW